MGGVAWGAKSAIAICLVIVSVILTLTINTMFATPKQTAELQQPVPQETIALPTVQSTTAIPINSVVTSSPALPVPKVEAINSEVVTELEVQDPVVISATFLDYNTQQPVENLIVRIYEKIHESANAPRNQEPVQVYETGPSNQLDIRGLKTGIYFLRAWSETHQTFDDEANHYEELIVVADQQPKQHTFTVFAGNTLAGIVTDEFTGEPLPSVKIKSRKIGIKPQHDEPEFVETITDENGFYPLPHVYGIVSVYFVKSPTGENKVPLANGKMNMKIVQPNIRVEKDGYTERRSLIVHRSPTELQLTRNQPIFPLSFQMRPTVQYQFSAVDEQGNIIPKASAKIFESKGGFGIASNDMTSAVNGIITLSLPVENRVNLFVTADGYETLTTSHIETTDQNPPFQSYELTKTENLQVTVRVVDRANKPVGVKLNFLHGTIGEQNSSYKTIGEGESNSYTGLYTHTFEKSSVFESETVYVQLLESERLITQRVSVTLQQARENETIEITYDNSASSEKYWSAGKIVGMDGLPLAGAVVFDPHGFNSATAITNAEGRYLLEGISSLVTGLYVRHDELGFSKIQNIERNGSYNDLDWSEANAIVAFEVINYKTKQPIHHAQCEAIEDFSQNIIQDDKRPNIFFAEEYKLQNVMVFISAEGYKSQSVNVGLHESDRYIPQLVELVADDSNTNQ